MDEPGGLWSKGSQSWTWLKRLSIHSTILLNLWIYVYALEVYWDFVVALIPFRFPEGHLWAYSHNSLTNFLIIPWKEPLLQTQRSSPLRETLSLLYFTNIELVHDKPLHYLQANRKPNSKWKEMQISAWGQVCRSESQFTCDLAGSTEILLSDWTWTICLWSIPACNF